MKVTGDQLPLYKAIVVIIIVTLQSPEFKKYLNRIGQNVQQKLLERRWHNGNGREN